MGIELDLIQTVAIGSFNPAIITPDWLHEVEVCQPAEDDAGAYFELAETAGFIAGGCDWEVDYTSLVVTDPKGDSDPGKVVAKVLDKLPHTPVDAVGHNFHFVSPRAAWGGVQPILGTQSLASLDAEEVRWDGRFSKADGWVEVTLRLPASDADFVLVRFNHHHLVEGASVKERSASAIKAAGRFAEDRDLTKAMLNKLFNLSWE